MKPGNLHFVRCSILRDEIFNRPRDAEGVFSSKRRIYEQILVYFRVRNRRTS